VEVVVIPSTPPELPTAPVSAYNLSWPPFWVEIMDPEGDLRFIYCKFTLLTDNPRISMQLKAKNTTLRDATYYFLRHKPYAELANLRRLDTLKEELMNVINYYILPEQMQTRGPDGAFVPVSPPQTERVRDILIEDYLIK
jgi:flagellar basal body-associated protein FliL